MFLILEERHPCGIVSIMIFLFDTVVEWHRVQQDVLSTHEFSTKQPIEVKSPDTGGRTDFDEDGEFTGMPQIGTGMNGFSCVVFHGICWRFLSKTVEM